MNTQTNDMIFNENNCCIDCLNRRFPARSDEEIDNMIFNEDFEPLNIKEPIDLDQRDLYPEGAEPFNITNLMDEILDYKDCYDTYYILHPDADKNQYNIFYYHYLIYRQFYFDNKIEMAKSILKFEEHINIAINHALFDNYKYAIGESDDPADYNDNATLTMITELHDLNTRHKRLLNFVGYTE